MLGGSNHIDDVEGAYGSSPSELESAVEASTHWHAVDGSA